MIIVTISTSGVQLQTQNLHCNHGNSSSRPSLIILAIELAHGYRLRVDNLVDYLLHTFTSSIRLHKGLGFRDLGLQFKV